MTTTARKAAFTLSDAGRQFGKHPSPWMIAATLAAALVARGLVGDWQLTDAVVPVVMIAAFPFLEWVIHVCILHWRPRRIGGVKVDPLLAAHAASAESRSIRCWPASIVSITSIHAMCR